MKKIKSSLQKLRAAHPAKRYGAGLFIILFASVGVAFLLRSMAAPQTAYLLADKTSVQTGTDVVITVRIDPGTPVDAVDLNIGFDASKFQYKSVDNTGSAFTLAAVTNSSNGNVNLVRALTGATISTDSLVARITFTATATASSTSAFTLSGQAVVVGTAVNLTYTGVSVNITAPTTTGNVVFTIEPTVAAPIVNTQFGLKVYVNSTTVFKGGEVTVNLPTGMNFTGGLDTTGTAFNPATTVAGTTNQIVKIVFVTQSSTMSGKQLIATIPVNTTQSGALSVTFSGARLVDANDTNITPVTSNPFNITINLAALPAPTLNIGTQQIGTMHRVMDLKQSFTIGNYDSAATYTVTFAGQNVPVTGNAFAIPSSVKNGDHTMLVASSKGGASGSATITIQLRSPNINRVGCVELLDLLSVNRGYGAPSTELDLDYNGTVGLIDLLTVTGKWGGECI